MIRRNLLRVLAFVALVVAGATLAFAAPAQAATKPIGLSTDGVTYTDTLSTSLFAGVLIVPGKSATRTFWVKNRSALPGNLAVALRGVSGGDANLIAALSLRGVAGATTGPTVAFTSANPCRTILSGVSLPAGAVIQVDLKLTLSSSLTQQTSQASVGAFKIPVTLTSTDVPAPDGCGPSTPVNPPTPPTHTGGTPVVTVPAGTIDTAEISGAADGSVPAGEVDNGPLSGLGGKGAVRSLAIIPNTGRFFQEWDVVGYLLALVVGGIFAWWWRRRRSYEEEAFA
jgi:hypothetical protein